MRTLIALLGLLLCSTGCDLPMSKTPIGTPWKTHELTKYNAAWIISGQAAPFTFLAQQDGLARIGIVESKPGAKQLRLVQIECVFTRIGKHEMLFFKASDDTEPPEDKNVQRPGYYFFLITKREEDKVFLAAPTQEFSKLVKAGKLPGEEIKDSPSSYPLITADEKTFLSVVESIGIEKCFDHKHPATVERIVAKRN